MELKIIVEEQGQGAAEYILLFGGVIVFAIAALLIYNSYFTENPYQVGEDLQTVRENMLTE